MKITLTLDLPESRLPELLNMCSPGATISQPPAEKPDVNGDAPAPVQPEPPAPANTAAPTVTKDDVFAMALKCSKAGKQKELAATFKKFGAKKLSEIAADDYPALMTALCEIGG